MLSAIKIGEAMLPCEKLIEIATPVVARSGVRQVHPWHHSSHRRGLATALAVISCSWSPHRRYRLPHRRNRPAATLGPIALVAGGCNHWAGVAFKLAWHNFAGLVIPDRSPWPASWRDGAVDWISLRASSPATAS